MFLLQLYFFIPNMKLECFQLSFDINIVHTIQKFISFTKFSNKNGKVFFLLDFCSTLQKTIADWVFFNDSIGK